MFMKYSQGGKIGYAFSEFIFDSEAELTQQTGATMGCKAYVIRTGETWIMDSENTWYPYQVFTGDRDPIKCECECVEESTIWNELPTAEPERTDEITPEV